MEGALAVAQRSGDLRLEMQILARFSRVDFWHLQWQETVKKGLRVIELAGQAEDQTSEARARLWVGMALLNQGQSKEARHHARVALAAAENLRFRYFFVRYSLAQRKGSRLRGRP